MPLSSIYLLARLGSAGVEHDGRIRAAVEAAGVEFTQGTRDGVRLGARGRSETVEPTPATRPLSDCISDTRGAIPQPCAVWTSMPPLLGADQFAQVDLTTCDQEPIHIPGSIQPHGVLLVARRADLIVTRASLNLSDWLGYTPGAALGRSLRQLLGDNGYDTLVKELATERDPLGQSLDGRTAESVVPASHGHPPGRRLDQR